MRDDEDDYRDYDEGSGNAVAVAFVWVLLVAICVAVCICCASCTTTKYVPIETVRTEYKDKIREVYTTDSVVDTRFVYVKGDTVIDYRDRILWRDRFVHDTCEVVKSDSIPVPYPVEKKLTPWQQTKQDYGGYAIAICVALTIVFAVRLARRLKRG